MGTNNDTNHDDKNHQRMATYLTNTELKSSDEVIHRLWRTICSAIPFCAVSLAMYEYASYMEILAIIMLCIFALPTIRLIWLISSAQHLYRIHSYSKVIPKWMRMPVTYKIGEFRQESVYSISEFSVIRGDEMIASMLTLSENIWLVSIIVFVFRMTEDASNDNDIIHNIHLDDVLMIIGVYGLLLRGIWDLNPWSLTQRVLHYIGDVCWMMVIGAYGVQTKWNYVFYVLSALAVLFFILWTLFSIKADNYKGDNIKKISLHSKLMLFCEICMLWQGVIALILWTYHYDEYRL